MKEQMRFIDQVAYSLAQKGLDQLKNYTIVVPMQRAELYFKQQFKQMLHESTSHQAIVLPKMLTIDQLVDELSGLRPSDEIRSICSLYAIYKRYITDVETLSLDAFYGWGRQLLQDFNSIDMGLCNTYEVVRNLSEAQEIDSLKIDDETRGNLIELVNLRNTNERVQTFFHHLWGVLPNIYEDFEAEQRQQGFGTKGACYKDVIDRFDEVVSRLEGRTMVFVGFNYLLPAEKKIMELFHQRHQALFFWDNDPEFDLDNTTYQFIRQHINEFGNSLADMPQATEKNENKHIQAIATKSANGQVQYISEWLQVHHHAGQRTAIVITDESLLESVLYSLPDTLNGKVNITKGYPLKNAPIYAQIVHFLSDKKNDRQSNETSYAGVLTRLIAHLNIPTTSEEDEPATWQELLQQEAYCQTMMVINRFLALIEEGVLDAIEELRTMRNLLKRALEMVSLPFHGEPVEEVQIIGVLETRLLDFDNLLILNVEEGIVPAKTADHSFIPFDLRKAYRMPTHDEDAKIYAYNFFRLIRRAKQTTLMYSEATGEMSQKTMSRFLMQLLLSDKVEVEKYSLTESTSTTDSASLNATKPWSSRLSIRNVRLADGTVIEKPMLSLSPSALADYIECHRQFYLKHIEGIASTEHNTLILNPNELGSFFHGAIEHAYKTICRGDIRHATKVDASTIKTFVAPETWEANSQACIQAGFEEIIRHYNQYHKIQNGEEIYQLEAHRAEAEVVKQMVKNVLQYDASHFAELELVSLEQDYRRLINIPTQDGNIDILLGGIIDRLDIVEEDGQRYLRILDYKAGSHNENKLKAKSIEEIFSTYDTHYVLQTMLYSWVCSAYDKQLNPQQYPIKPQLMFTQKLSADKHILIDNSAVDSFARYSQDFEKQLCQTIQQILEEHLQEEPWKMADTTICEKSFCPFHLICKREKREW